MEAFSAGTLAGAGSFSCDGCGFAIALHELDEVPTCPECGGTMFKRASLFTREESVAPPAVDGPPRWLEDAREAPVPSGAYLASEDDQRVRVLPLQAGGPRTGPSLAAAARLAD